MLCHSHTAAWKAEHYYVGSLRSLVSWELIPLAERLNFL